MERRAWKASPKWKALGYRGKLPPLDASFFPEEVPLRFPEHSPAEYQKGLAKIKELRKSRQEKNSKALPL
jgi:hypothetical protein